MSREVILEVGQTLTSIVTVHAGGLGGPVLEEETIRFTIDEILYEEDNFDETNLQYEHIRTAEILRTYPVVSNIPCSDE